MWTKTHQWLAGLLAAQLLLAGGLVALEWRRGAAPASSTVLTLAQDQADRITIDSGESSKATLLKKDGQWRLPQAADLPADATQVAQLLGRLGGLKAGAPVATSADAQQRFKVADALFERRITLAGGGKPLATLLLGTSQGARLSHARRGGDTDVIAVELAAFDVPAKDDDWLDKALLRVARDDISAIELGGLRLLRQAAAPAAAGASVVAAATAASGPASAASAAAPTEAALVWSATGLSAGEVLDTAAADKLAGLLADLRIGGLIAATDAAAQKLAQPELVLTLVRKGGAKVDYRLAKIEGQEDYALKMSAPAQVFKLPAYAAKPLIDAAKRATLVPPQNGASAAAAAK